MSDVAAVIQNIIDNRKPFLNKTVDAAEQLESLSGLLQKFQILLKQIIKREISEQKIAEIQSIESKLDAFLKSITNRTKEIDTLKRRFNRDTLNIGIIGYKRNGKSRFLQTLTGLDDNVIPTGDHGACTGAPSEIYNCDHFSAVIKFYKEEEFFQDVIAPYFNALTKYVKLPVTPNRKMEFLNLELPEEPEWEDDISDSDKTKQRTIYKNLWERWKRFGEYKAHLDGQDEIITRPEDVRQWVAQETPDHTPLVVWNAVKMATIRCPFPLGQNIGNIGVFDTPGMGDLLSGWEEKVARVIGEKIDTVVMLRQVTDTGNVDLEDHDRDLYALIPTAINDLDKKEWSYFVVNKRTKDEGRIQHLLDELKKYKVETRKPPFVVNVADYSDVEPKYKEIIEDIASNQAALDKTLYERRMQKVSDLLAAIEEYISSEPVKTLLKQYDNAQIEDSVARNKFRKEIWNGLRNRFTDLRKKYEAKAADPNNELQKWVERLEEIKNDEEGTLIVPDVEFIRHESKADPRQWYDIQRNKTLVQVSKQLGKIGENLAELFDELRRDACKCFCEVGRLANVITMEGDALDVTSNEGLQNWWGMLADEIAKLPDVVDGEVRNDFIDAIRRFQKATLSYEQLLEPRIIMYGCLNSFYPDKDEARVYDINSGEFEPELMRQKLMSAVANVLEKVCNLIKEEQEKDGVKRGVLIEPSAALFSTIEKFYLTMFCDEPSMYKWEEFYTGSLRDAIFGTDGKKGVPLSEVQQYNGLLKTIVSKLEKAKNICLISEAK